MQGDPMAKFIYIFVAAIFVASGMILVGNTIYEWEISSAESFDVDVGEWANGTFVSNTEQNQDGYLVLSDKSSGSSGTWQSDVVQLQSLDEPGAEPVVFSYETSNIRNVGSSQKTIYMTFEASGNEDMSDSDTYTVQLSGGSGDVVLIDQLPDRYSFVQISADLETQQQGQSPQLRWFDFQYNSFENQAFDQFGTAGSFLLMVVFVFALLAFRK